MDFFKEYLRYKYKLILFYVISALFLSFSFAIFELPMKASLYPVIIITIVGLGILIFDYIKSYHMHKDYERVKNYYFDLSGDFPKSQSINEDDLKEIVINLSGYNRTQSEEAYKKYSDMIEYYTVWCHQIKTPIAAMRLSLHNENTPFSRHLKGELDRIESYVDMVLAYLRLDSDSTDYVFKEYDLDIIVKACIRKFSREFIDRKISMNYSDLNMKVLTDEKWLSFVIEQIISNALKYTKEGSISIFSKDENTLCIKDTGIGIDPADLPRIFENGFTGFNGRSDKKASGIGLYLCKRTCDALGHRICVTSDVGIGTTVYIDLSKAELDVE